MFDAKGSLLKSTFVILSIVISIVVLIITIIASLLITKYIYVNRTYPETIKYTNISAISIWEYEEDERKLIFSNNNNKHTLKLKTNTESIYYEVGLLPDAGKYKYSAHIMEISEDSSKDIKVCAAYFYEDRIKLEFNEGTPNIFGFSSNEIILKKGLEISEYSSAS